MLNKATIIKLTTSDDFQEFVYKKMKANIIFNSSKSQMELNYLNFAHTLKYQELTENLITMSATVVHQLISRDDEDIMMTDEELYEAIDSLNLPDTAPDPRDRSALKDYLEELSEYSSMAQDVAMQLDIRILEMQAFDNIKAMLGRYWNAQLKGEL